MEEWMPKAVVFHSSSWRVLADSLSLPPVDSPAVLWGGWHRFLQWRDTRWLFWGISAWGKNRAWTALFFPNLLAFSASCLQPQATNTLPHTPSKALSFGVPWDFHFVKFLDSVFLRSWFAKGSQLLLICHILLSHSKALLSLFLTLKIKTASYFTSRNGFTRGWKRIAMWDRQAVAKPEASLENKVRGRLIFMEKRVKSGRLL